MTSFIRRKLVSWLWPELYAHIIEHGNTIRLERRVQVPEGGLDLSHGAVSGALGGVRFADQGEHDQ